MSNPLNTKESIGSRIKALRAKADMTQAELAEKLNLTDKAVSKWESGEGAPNVEVLADLASLLGTTTDYLLTGKEPNQPKPAEAKPVVMRTEEENLRILASTIQDGYYSIDRVIAIDDYELYQFALTRIVCLAEDLWESAKAKNWRRVFKLAVDNNLRPMVEAMIAGQTDVIPVIIGCFLVGSPEINRWNLEIYASSDKMTAPNYKYFESVCNLGRYDKASRPLQEGEPEALDAFFENNKRKVFLDSVFNCNDFRFFKDAIPTKQCDLDAALERAIKERPQNFELQELFLDHGAKLHHRWIEDPGDEYERSCDEVDEVATQLLKNQIAVLLKKGN
jgi:transcriptional regulator with XRE-family HTH domain